VLFEQQLESYLKKNPSIEVVRLIEVGAWKGRSSVAIARICRRLTAVNRRKCTLLSVDTWTGSIEHFLRFIDSTQKIMIADITTDGILRYQNYLFLFYLRKYSYITETSILDFSKYF